MTGAWKAAISDAIYAGQFDVVRAVETWSRRDVLPGMQELLMNAHREPPTT